MTVDIAYVPYLDDAVYDDVMGFIKENVDWSGPAAEVDFSAAVAVLTRESRTLDARDYEAWLALFAPKSIYWVPLNEIVGDPRTEPSVHFDDYRRLADRVALIRTGNLHAQTPPSRTCRVLSNIECRHVDDRSIDVHSSLVVHEQRRERKQLYVGRQFHRLEWSGDTWQIRYRVFLLLDRDISQGNITFIL